MNEDLFYVTLDIDQFNNLILQNDVLINRIEFLMMIQLTIMIFLIYKVFKRRSKHD